MHLNSYMTELILPKGKETTAQNLIFLSCEVYTYMKHFIQYFPYLYGNCSVSYLAVCHTQGEFCLPATNSSRGHQIVVKWQKYSLENHGVDMLRYEYE